MVSRLEALLAARRLGTTVCRYEVGPVAAAATGMPSLDAALGGGWRRGEVSEITGGPSSGRTSVLGATLAAATIRGELAALVDAFDRHDPATLAAARAVLSRVLWVRGPALSLRARASLAGLAVRRAVRACDLLIRAGGFGLVALDLVGAPPAALDELAASTWLRLAQANAGAATVCLLVSDRPLGRSARGVSVRLAAARRWTGTSARSRRFAGFEIEATLCQAQRPAAPVTRWTLPAAM